MSISLLLATGSAITIGGADFVGGLAARRMPAIPFTASAQTVNVVLLLALAPFSSGIVASRDIVFGVLAGIAGSIAFAVFLIALAAGPMSIVSPVSAVVGASGAAALGIALGDRPTTLALVGGVLGILAIAMVASEGRGGRTIRWKTLALAIGAGVGFGAFIVLLDRPSKEAGLWPLVAARIAGVIALTLLATLRRERARPRGALIPLALAVGGFETIAIISLQAALHAGSLTLVAIVSSLYPVTTVLLARFTLHERLARHQLVGVALALGAVSMIAGG